MAVEIKKCSCSGTPAANFQDKEYGPGMRVMNVDVKKTSVKCTVCNKEQKA